MFHNRFVLETERSENLSTELKLGRQGHNKKQSQYKFKTHKIVIMEIIMVMHS